MYAIVSCSLHPTSRSRGMARHLADRFETCGETADWIDLREAGLPWCDGGSCYGDPAVHRVAQRLSAARGIVLAAPVYNYDVNAAAKNLVELTGKNVWSDKVIGFVCAAGGKASYMAPMSLAVSLMLDFRCLVLPSFVFATGAAFDQQQQLTDTDTQDRLQKLAETMVRVTRALHADPNNIG